jgi:hypothetical protein
LDPVPRKTNHFVRPTFGRSCNAAKGGLILINEERMRRAMPISARLSPRTMARLQQGRKLAYVSKEGKSSVPAVLIPAPPMQSAVALFKLHLQMRHGEANGRVADGTVKGGVQYTAKTWQQ